jgi:hypothetical protein
MDHNVPPDHYQYETDEGIPIEQGGESEDAYEEADEFHDPSVAGENADERDEFALPRESSPEKYFVKLRRSLSEIGVRYERLTKKTPEGGEPPCFALAGADYDSWLTAASLTSDVPYRYDMPGEPNYCRDCTVQFRHKAILAGKCQFPNVRFEIAQSNGEKEVVGVSRSPMVVPNGYRVYRQLVIDEAALEDPDRKPARGRLPRGNDKKFGSRRVVGLIDEEEARRKRAEVKRAKPPTDEWS